MKTANRRVVVAIVTMIVMQGVMLQNASYALPARSSDEGQALTLPAGKAGQSYEYQLLAEGGLPPFTWKIIAGELPPGIKLGASGELEGTPTAPRREAYSFVAQVSDSSSTPQRLSQGFLLMINAKPLRIVTEGTSLRAIPPGKEESISPLAPNMNSKSSVSGAQRPIAQVAGHRLENTRARTTAATEGDTTDSATEAAAADDQADKAKAVKEQIDDSEYSWGRVRAYFTGAMIFSKERDDFSKQDLALGFNLDKNYLQRKNFNINTFFETRLTAIPVSAQDKTADSSSTTPPPTKNEMEEDKFATFLASKKAALMQVGTYLPWAVSTWRFRGDRNQMFIAPLVKGGVQTITGGFKSAEAKRVGNDDVFNFYSFGVRLGHFRYDKSDNPNAPDIAPELISYIDITRGRWENFEILKPVLGASGKTILDPTPTDPTNPLTVRERRYRWAAEGRLKIPETPLIVGFDGNFGDGPDDLRFIFGVKFDIGKLFSKLKVLESIGLQEAAAQKAQEKANQKK